MRSDHPQNTNGMGADLCSRTMKVPYRIYPDSFGSYIYSAALDISLALPVPHSPRTRRFEVIIDSGAARCMFHADIGRYLGLDMTSGRLERTQGIGGSEDTWIHQVVLYIPGGPVHIHAAFKENLPLAGLLGMNGFSSILQLRSFLRLLHAYWNGLRSRLQAAKSDRLESAVSFAVLALQFPPR